MLFYKSEMFKRLMPAFVGFFLVAFCAFLNPINHFLCSLVLFIGALFGYFYIVFCLTDRNWMDIRAIFFAVWLLTLSLASLRLTDYQKQWESATWILSAAGFGCFQLGALAGIRFGERKIGGIASRIKERFRSFHFEGKRIFWICLIVGAVGIACFSINVWIKGFLPCFSNDIYAYRNFYTKFHIFSVAATTISGLCYYCLRSQPLALWKKIVLWVLIFYNVILFPILVVSRGVFVISALVFSTVFFYTHKKSLVALIFCIVAIMAVYLFASNLRSYTDDYLSIVFAPTKIELGENNESETVTSEDISYSYFQLPPKVAFLYGYLTVSHDNFNEAVLHSKECTYGLRQLKPFNVLLRSDQLEKRLENAEYYQVSPHLNTTNFFGIFYYDFHALGVVFFSFLWAFVFGLFQSAYSHLKGPFSLMALGNAMNPVVLAFFSGWIDQFEIWMFWGTIFLMFLASSVHFVSKKKSKE